MIMGRNGPYLAKTTRNHEPGAHDRERMGRERMGRERMSRERMSRGRVGRGRMERSGNGTGATSPPGHHGPF
jgi:hypothetical protein